MLLSSLDIVLVEILLEVEVGELISGGNAEELHERSIGLDVVLVAETLLLDIGTNELSDFRARGSGVLALAEEETEFIGDRLGDLERNDGRSAIGVFLTGNLALLLGFLDFLGHTLFEALEVGKDTLESGDLGFNSGLESLDFFIPGDFGNGGFFGDRLGSDDRGDNLGFGLLDFSLLDFLDRGSGDLGVGLGSSGLLVSGGLGRSSGGSGGLGHFTGGGGIHLGVFYASLCLYIEHAADGNFLPVTGPFCQFGRAFTFFFEVRSQTRAATTHRPPKKVHGLRGIGRRSCVLPKAIAHACCHSINFSMKT